MNKLFLSILLFNLVACEENETAAPDTPAQVGKPGVRPADTSSRIAKAVSLMFGGGNDPGGESIYHLGSLSGFPHHDHRTFDDVV